MGKSPSLSTISSVNAASLHKYKRCHDNLARIIHWELSRENDLPCNGDRFRTELNHCALQQSLFIQYVKTEKYNNIESLNN